jgi:hypothetical protein
MLPQRPLKGFAAHAFTVGSSKPDEIHCCDFQ